jgi:serine/threonine protein kinase
VERYIESAIVEAEILMNIQKSDLKGESHCVKLFDYFSFYDNNIKYLALVFEKLGKSLYEFIKDNRYRGFHIDYIRQFARQIFEGIGYLHDHMGLTHTDLKPENLLLKHNDYDFITDPQHLPKVNDYYNTQRMY